MRCADSPMPWLHACGCWHASSYRHRFQATSASWFVSIAQFRCSAWLQLVEMTSESLQASQRPGWSGWLSVKVQHYAIHDTFDLAIGNGQLGSDGRLWMSHHDAVENVHQCAQGVWVTSTNRSSNRTLPSTWVASERLLSQEEK
jgi:hypothetical protein